MAGFFIVLLIALFRCKQCDSTIPNCLDCLTLDRSCCRLCQEGFLPVNGLCVEAAVSMSCTSYLGGACTTCLSEHILLHDGNQMGACIACSHTMLALGPGCKDCALVGGVPHCFACHPNYLSISTASDSGVALLRCTPLNDDHLSLEHHQRDSSRPFSRTTCTVSNCQACTSQAPDVCVQCTRGYSLINGGQSCVCSVSHCAACSSTDGLQCTQCLTNYALTSNRTCACSVRNCIDCDSYGTSPCLQCAPGYKLSEDGSTCSCGVDNCSICDSTDGAYCITCVTGYIQSYSRRSCTCAVEHCEECFPADGSQCLRCVKNYELYYDFKKCAGIMDNCLYTSPLDGLMCSVCNSGYVTASSGAICVDAKCHVLYCEQCDGTLCTQCKKGYSLMNGGLECACSASNCLICNPDDGNLCFKCIGGYDITPSGLCECTLQNCAECSQDGMSCKACVNGYRQGESGCECSLDACKTCNPTDGQLCDECYLNYDLVHGACVKKIPGCIAASLVYENVCELCDTNWELSYGQCLCKVRNCDVCHENGLKCVQCVEGFTLQNDNTECACTLANCAECDPRDGTECLACTTGHQPDAHGHCISDTCSINNCKRCASSTTCSECYDNYDLSTDKQTCTCMLANCSKCKPSNGQQCLECKTGYKLDMLMNQCLCSVHFCETCSPSDGSRCDACIAGFIKGPTSTSCNCAVDNCRVCNLSDGTKCEICDLGHTLTAGTCSPTVAYCKSYSKSRGCIECELGFSLMPLNLECLCTVQNCDTYSPTDGSECKSCVKNYLKEGNLCHCQVARCLRCDSTDGELCSTCIKNYVLSEDKASCECSVPNCMLCISRDGGQCYICEDGYRLTEDASCEEVPCSVMDCLSCPPDNPDICLVCRKGFWPADDRTRCACSDPACSECDFEDGALCLDCNANYTEIGSKCFCSRPYCVKCDIDDGSICEQCEEGFVLTSANACILRVCFAGQDNCELCGTGAHANKCLMCINGYVPINGVCVQDSKQDICIQSLGVCTSCVSTYFFWQNGCYPCSMIPNCIECYMTSAYGPLCKMCEAFYTLRGGKCQLDPYCSRGCECDDNLQCIGCITGYVMMNDICTLCEDLFYMCAECTSTFCIRCFDGYSVVNDDCVLGTCKEGTHGCLVCANDYTCMQCRSGMYLYRGACRECNFAGSNCAECIFNGEYQCLKCLENHVSVVSNGIFYCAKCPDIAHCLKCAYNSTRPSQFQCALCDDPWLIDTVTGTCYMEDTSNMSTTVAVSCSVIGVGIVAVVVIAVIIKHRHHVCARMTHQNNLLDSAIDKSFH